MRKFYRPATPEGGVPGTIMPDRVSFLPDRALSGANGAPNVVAVSSVSPQRTPRSTSVSPGRAWVDAFLGRGHDTPLDRYLVGLPFYRPLSSVTEMAKMSLTVFKVLVTPPFTWVRESVVETSRALRLVTLPMLFSSLGVRAGVRLGAAGPRDLRARRSRPRGTGRLHRRAARAGHLAHVHDPAPASWRARWRATSARARSATSWTRSHVLGVDRLRTLVVPRVVAIMVSGLVLSLIVLARHPDRRAAARHDHDPPGVRPAAAGRVPRT